MDSNAFNEFYRNVDDESDITRNGESLHNLLEYFKNDISPIDKSVLNQQYKEKSLFRDVLKTNSDYGIFNADRPENFWGLAQLCFTIQKLYQYQALNQFDEVTWKAVVSSIVIDMRFSTRIGAKFGNNFRLLGKVLTKAHNSPAFTIKDVTPSNREVSRRLGNPLTTFNKILNAHPSYFKWFEEFDRFIDEKIMKSQREHKTALSKLCTFVIDTAKIEDPVVYFSEKRADFYDWLSKNNPKNILPACRIAQDFSVWYVNTYLTDYIDGATAIGHPLFDNIRYLYILKQQKAGLSTLSETNKTPMPTKLVFMCKDILSEDDYSWSKSLNSELYQYYNSKTKSYEENWCPTNTILFLILLEIPMRKIQITSLDSGEGDEFKYDTVKKTWIRNPNTNAGYWKKVGAQVQSRGVLRQNSSSLDKVDLYINTNKTADIKTQFDEKSGYVIPWHNETVIFLVDFLRNWQETYNPVSEPMSYSEIPENTFSSNPTKAAIDNLPDRFYLFRSHLNTSHSQAPIADYRTFRFWHQLMDELEKRLHAQGDDIRIITKRNKNGEPISSIFTPHGLRVTGLTAFMQAGVPIEVLSKIVAGHKSILMTLHYIKYSNTHISDVLNEAQHKLEGDAQEDFSKWLKETSWKDAYKYSVFNSEDTFESGWGNSSHLLFENRDFGICPTAGTTCDKGGSIIRRSASGSKHLYGAVPGGKGNCIMCRFFVTGKPWLIPLWIKANSLFAEAQRISENLEKHRNQLDVQRKERYGYIKSSQSVPANLRTKIQQFEGAIDKMSLSLDEKLTECHRAYNLQKMVRELPKLDGETAIKIKDLPALLQSDDEDFIFDETSRFRHLDFIVQGAKFCADIDTEVFEKDRNHFIDSFLFNSGMTPITLTPLADSEKKQATDAIAKYLTEKLSDKELQQLENNTVTLEDLGYKSNLQDKLDGYANQIPFIHLD